MPPVYTQSVFNSRLQVVISAIDAGAGNGIIQILGNSIVLSTVPLQKPSGSVAGGILSFNQPLNDPSAAQSGAATSAQFVNSQGVSVITGLTVGIPFSGADVIINNGINTTTITAGQPLSVVVAQITGN